MPFNGSGVYSLPAGYLAVAGATILSTQHNSPLEDIKSALDLTFLRDGRAPMTGPLTLLGNASSSLHAVPKQQLDAQISLAPTIGTRSGIKALDTTRYSIAFLNEGGRDGVFVWTTGDFTSKIALDTSEGMYLKATAIASNLGAWVRITDRITPQMCGATVDGVTNCYAESFAAFELAKRELLVWHCPAGNYLWNLGGGSAAWDPTELIRGARRAIPMTGAGTDLTNIEITNASSIGWHIYTTTDWFDFNLTGMTVFGAFNFPLMAIGQNNFVDPANMIRFTDVSLENSYNGSSNVALRLNYIAGGTCVNLRCNSYALAVANVLVAVNGTALECRQVEFVSFVSGGFGNADRSVDFKDGVNFGNTFTSPTLENCNYAVSHRNSNSGAQTFISPQITNVLQYEVHSSGALSGRDILIVNPNCDGPCEVDPANYTQVRIKDDAAITTPTSPATSVAVANATGRDVLVTYWGLTTLSSINLDGAGDGITTTSGSFILRAGKSVAFNYTGSLTWRWRNAG